MISEMYSVAIRININYDLDRCNAVEISRNRDNFEVVSVTALFLT
jgi:hypothetical protein